MTFWTHEVAVSLALDRTSFRGALRAVVFNLVEGHKVWMRLLLTVVALAFSVGVLSGTLTLKIMG